jgi:hypothetical protein
MNAERILSLAMGILVVGEAILLLIGMYGNRAKKVEWKTRFNTNTLLIDVAFGVILIFNAVEDMPLKIIAIGALIITHGFREFEYFHKGKKDQLIFNIPLLAVNTIKLVGILFLLILVL